MVFGKQPERISSTAYIGETGVDERFSALFEYGNGKSAQVNGGVRLRMVNEAYIYGSEGYIHLPDFLSSRKAYLYRDDAVSVTFEDKRSVHGYLFEAEEAMRCLREGRKEKQTLCRWRKRAILCKRWTRCASSGDWSIKLKLADAMVSTLMIGNSLMRW